MREHSELADADYLIGALGTEIEDAQGEPLSGYSTTFTTGWDRSQIARVIAEIGGLPHPPEFQTPFKVSCDVDTREAANVARRRLREAGLEVSVLLTHGTKLDVVPANAGKGEAIEYIRQAIGVPPERVVVAGDSANDIDMFRPSSRGIIVGNADEELAALTGPNVYHARRGYAGGVLDGLKHWKIIS